MPRAIKFTCSGRFAHFLKAEGNASAPTYPVPPRTALLGMLGAVLGLPKDAPQTELVDCCLAVAGDAEFRHWHSANLRKDAPTPLPWTVRKNSKGSSAEQRNTIIAQEWLVRPCFTVWAVPPERYCDELAERLAERRWHFSPCLGLSEMLADLSLTACCEAEPLSEGVHWVVGTVRRDEARLDLDAACSEQLAVQTLRLPRDVSPGRSFTHSAYYREKNARPMPVQTTAAWRLADDTVMWL